MTCASAFGGEPLGAKDTRADSRSACAASLMLSSSHAVWSGLAIPTAALVTSAESSRSGGHTRDRETRGSPSQPCVTRDLLEEVGCVPEGHAAIALAMCVPALEALTAVAEHQRAGCHERGAEWRSVLETARQHGRNRVALVPFFERPIVGAAGAQDVGDGPVVAGRDHAGDVPPVSRALVAGPERWSSS